MPLRANPQQQRPVTWPNDPMIARAYIDQLQRSGVFADNAAEVLNRFVLYICLPAAILRAAPKLEFSVGLLGLVAVQYGLHVWQLGQGTSPWLVRPDVVDGFLPIAGGLGLRAWLSQGIVDPHHPAATITVLVLCLSALLLGRAFCAWFCPLGLVGEWLHGLRSRLLPGDWTPPRWLDVVLRSQKFLVLAFLLFIVLIAVPGAALPGYLASPYHQAADMKMGAFFFNLTLISGLCLCWVLLLTVAFRQGFCRYLCPYGAWLALLGMWVGGGLADRVFDRPHHKAEAPSGAAVAQQAP